MLEQLIPFIPSLAKVNLTLLEAAQASLISIHHNNTHFHISCSIADTSQVNSASLAFADGTKTGKPDQSAQIDTHSASTLSLGFSSGSDCCPHSPPELELSEPPQSLPFNTGLYLDFADPNYFDTDWWLTCPSYHDVTPNLRLVPLAESICRVPSLESKQRLISVSQCQDSLSVQRQYDSISFLIDLTVNVSTKPLYCESRSSTWSLRYLPPGKLIELRVDRTSMAIRYSRRVFSQLWWLVNHHTVRGDEAYMLLGRKTKESRR